VSDLDALPRDQLIATLTLLGWEPQYSLIVNRNAKVVLTKSGDVWPESEPRVTKPGVDGWHNFSDEHLKRFLRRIEAEPL
jgi:hypothetical protein